MGEIQAGITVNDDDISLREWIAKHSDHLDEGIHQINLDLIELRNAITGARAELGIVAMQVKEIHQELEAARPMIEKWQHSKIRRLAQGDMPWQTK